MKQNKLISYPVGLFTNNEIKQYSNSFNYYFDKENYIVKFKFKRIIGSKERPVYWIAMNTEGMATLISLINLTSSHPKILCTIQSGILERANSLFFRLIDHFNIKSRIWIRGFWNTCYNDRPIEPCHPYNSVVQDYGYWYSPMGEPEISFEENNSEFPLSNVRAFSRENLEHIPGNINLNNGDRNSINLIKGDINNISVEDYDLIITSKRIYNNPPHANVKFWNEYYTREDSLHYPNLLFAESLDIIQEIILSNNAKKIAITPIGFEDETQYLYEFLQSIDLEFQLDIYYKRPLDFITITAPNAL